jgi:hypothetical protein
MTASAAPHEPLFRQEDFMLKAFAFGLLLISISAVGWTRSASGQENPAAPPKKPEVSKVHFVVIHADTGKPVSGATVNVQWGDGGEAESRDATTGTQGLAKLEEIPRRRVKVVVVATKYCTFRHSYDISKPEESIEVRLRKDDGQCPD